jgi:hypothetical protein
MTGNSKFVVYKEDDNMLGLCYKDTQFSNRVYVEVGDKVIEYDGIAEYLADGWMYTAYLGDEGQSNDQA